MITAENLVLPHLTLMITASYDKILTPDAAKPMTKFIPNLQVHELAAAHWVHLEKPKELNEILLRWLNQTVKPKLVIATQANSKL